MSATTGRRARHENNAPESVPQDAPQSPPQETAPQGAPEGGTETSTMALETATLSQEFKEMGLTINLPRKAKAGDVLDADDALILDTAKARQFGNNMNANAKARAARLTAATTANDAAAIAANAPYTAEDVLKIWADYKPNVGGGPRLGSMEKMRHDAAWAAWLLYIAEHDAAVKAGEAPLIGAMKDASGNPCAVPTSYYVPPRKPRNATAEQTAAHEAALAEFEAARTAHILRMLDMPKYAERIQVQLDRITAEKGRTAEAAPAAGTVQVAAAALLD